MFKTYYYDSIVIGTGAAGYNAANRIKQFNKKSVAIVTEHVMCGTSRNTGSDKQTYYKLGLGGSAMDSVEQMANNLFSGGAMDGDNALCEAALSARCFHNLCELGVDFPTNRYGEYIGYKTDHDPYARATSVGPLTSKHMTEALQKKCEKEKIDIYDKCLAVEILNDSEGVYGLICYDKQTEEFVIFICPNVVLATGGPAGMYADSVYPNGHTGSTGLAVETGAHLQNMTEWQYGMASLKPRWNVSGTYMQVLPRLVSIDEFGIEHEFLEECYDDVYEALSMLFLKGYQWPFDSRKAVSGSSVIDLLVYRETVLRSRRVYLDYTKNPFGLKNIYYEKLSKEAYEYLSKAGACFGTPIERLLKMNTPAVELYRSKGVDISKEYLEIAVCAQHNNGGISVDMWWQTSVCGLYAVGECAGTHGISRPGGSALNSGQVGSLRAAQYISYNGRLFNDVDIYRQKAIKRVEEHKAFIAKMKNNDDNINVSINNAQRRMSDCGAAIRNPESITIALEKIKEEIQRFNDIFGIGKKGSIEKAYKLKDILIMQYTTLYAMMDFCKKINATRGSALYYNPNGSKNDNLEERFRFVLQDTKEYDKIQEVWMENGALKCSWRNRRPIPTKEDFFENIWNQYNVNKNIY